MCRAWRTVWMIYCPNLFPGFWTACRVDLLSLRVVAESTSVWDVLQCRRSIMLMMLMAYKIPLSPAVWNDHRSKGPTWTCMLSVVSSDSSITVAAAPRWPSHPEAFEYTTMSAIDVQSRLFLAGTPCLIQSQLLRRFLFTMVVAELGQSFRFPAVSQGLWSSRLLIAGTKRAIHECCVFSGPR